MIILVPPAPSVTLTVTSGGAVGMNERLGQRSPATSGCSASASRNEYQSASLAAFYASNDSASLADPRLAIGTSDERRCRSRCGNGISMSSAVRTSLYQ